MKKIYTLFILLIVFRGSYAATFPVTVANFSFNPNTINATVGDVIQFNWQSGSHTTTCGPALAGTSMPAGATPWNNPMNAGNTTFSYTLTVAGTYFFGCIPHFGGGAGMAGTINVSGVAPVTFGSFTAAAADASVLLNWTTETEQNTAFFTVKKSTDGIHFNPVATVPAAGNSGTLRAYNYSDNTGGDKYSFLFYEIETSDLDHKTTLSPIKTVRTNRPNEHFIVQLGPNPIIRPALMKILFNAEERGQMDVKIYSVAGRMVLKDKMEAFYGLNNAHLHVCELPAGEYVAVFTLAGKKETGRIVIK